MWRKDREITDESEILDLVSKAKILHLGLIDDDYPYPKSRIISTQNNSTKQIWLKFR